MVKSKEVKAVKFACPDCRNSIHAEYMILDEDKFFLVGVCDICNEHFRFLISDIILKLLDGKPMPHAKGSN